MIRCITYLPNKESRGRGGMNEPRTTSWLTLADHEAHNSPNDPEPEPFFALATA